MELESFSSVNSDLTQDPKKPQLTTTSKSQKNKTLWEIIEGKFDKKALMANDTIAELVVVIVSFYGILYASQVASIFTCQQVKFNNTHKIYQYVFVFCMFYFIVMLMDKKGLGLPPIEKFINCIFFFFIFLILNRLDYNLMIVVLGLFFIVFLIFINTQYYYNVDPITNDVTLKASTRSPSSISFSSLYSFDSPSSPPPPPPPQNNSPNLSETKYWLTWSYPTIHLFPVRVYQYYYLSLLNKFILVIIVLLVITGFINYIGLLKYTFKNKITLYNIFFETPTCEPLNYALSFSDYMLLAFNYNYYIKKVKPINKSVYPYD